MTYPAGLLFIALHPPEPSERAQDDTLSDVSLCRVEVAGEIDLKLVGHFVHPSHAERITALAEKELGRRVKRQFVE